MIWNEIKAAGNILGHKTSKQEIQDLFGVIERDLGDAKVKGLSSDRRFATAYNAALQAATIVMHCLGYRAKSEAHHYTTFMFLREALGGRFAGLADYFNACRAKRNITDYDRAGEISDKEADELVKETMRFYGEIKNWVSEKFPQYFKS